MQKKLLAIAVSALSMGAITGCTHFGGAPDMQNTVSDRSKSQVQSEIDRNKAPDNTVRRHTKPYLDFKPVEARAERGSFTITANDTPFAALVAEAARKAGFTSVSFADNVDAKRKVSVNFVNATPEAVLRETAFLAGYVAVINRVDKTVSITDTATFTYKVPTSLFQNTTASINVGGNPAPSSSSSSGGGGSSGGSSGGGSTSGLKAEFTISGKVGQNGNTLAQYLREIAGKNAEVSISQEAGIISVRANAQALKRTTEVIKGLVRDATTEIIVEASLVEVALQDDFQLGVDWSRVLNGFNGGGLLSVDFKSSTGVTSPSFTGTYTKGSITSVVKALRQYTDTQIVSRPQLRTINHVPVTLFEGSSEPYLGSVATTVTGTTGTSQTSGAASFAMEGISLSLQADTIGSNKAEITILPVISKIRGWETFDLGSNSSLKVPKQGITQGHMRVTAEAGQTIIIGGIRYVTNDASRNAGLIPYVMEGRNTVKGAKEVILMLNTQIVPPREVNPILSESV